MRLIRFAFCFSMIGGAVLLFHHDAAARPAAPVSLVQGTTLAMASEDDGQRSGFLGVTVARMGDQLREAFDVPAGAGVLVEEVEPDSPAERAGIRAGDVIVSFDGEEVASSTELARAIRAAGADAQVAVGFYRKGRFRQESAALEARSAQRIARFNGPVGSDDWTDEEWDEWGERFGERMEQWGEEFGARWEENGEQWEEFGERMAELGERLGEEWGEEQAAHWEAWGEEFGGRMSEWGENFGERMAEWGEHMAERWEDADGNVHFDERDLEELHARLEESLGSIDWDAMSVKLQADIDEAVNSVDWEQIERDVQASIDSVDWDAISVDVHGAIRDAIDSLEQAGVLVERGER